ncbi:MAG: 2-isopropylmalate synthase [Fibrobacteria bacterium]|nr:2-isopropylmalate synthase [Fibrobacteria bacterium]
MKSKEKNRQPFFYDVTLRDGNQALKKPWNIKEKEKVFNQLIQLGVQGIEVGFCNASKMDFDTSEHIAKLAPDHIVISGLARALDEDIEVVWEAVKHAAKPRIHTFISTSAYNMENVLKKTPQQVLESAVRAIQSCSRVMGGKGDIQFSPEHFGDCKENLDFVIELILAVIEAGAGVINLPNTVERYRPSYFTDMVTKVVKSVGNKAVIAVHNHNDLGMATATTVESFFAGATQLETTLIGLGERAGNTNIAEVACALYNCGVEMPINLEAIYEASIMVAELANIPIPEKAPLIGADVIVHRSGIHQDGTIKTKSKSKGAYRGFDLSIIGRKETDRLGITSQSGKTAVFEIIKRAGLPITMDEATYLQPILKKISEVKGELELALILETYEKEIFSVAGPLVFIDLHADHSRKSFDFKFSFNNEVMKVKGKGSGPVEACFNALNNIGLKLHLLEYKQHGQDVEYKNFAAFALSEIVLKSGVENGNGKVVVARAKDEDTVKANVKAVFNGANLLFRAGAKLS